MKFSIGNLRVEASDAAITVSLGPHSVFALPARVAVDADGKADVDLFAPAYREEQGRCIWTVRSSNWACKELSLAAEGNAVVLRTRVQGCGKLGKLRFFPEAGGGLPLQYEVARYLLPAASFAPHAGPQYRNTMQSASLDLGYMTPPLLAFPFVGPFAGSCAIGLVPKPGTYNLDHFRCEFAAPAGGLFSTDFLGYTAVDGDHELPALTFTAGADEFAALAGHAEWLYAAGGCRRVDRGRVPRWWLGPFFCGWGEQAILSEGRSTWAVTEGSGCDLQSAMASQENYAAMSARLDELGLKPAALIVDAKWQETFGAMLPDPVRWPDMRGFVDREHAKGRRVVLWLKAWDNEGLRSRECVHCLCTPYGADPTSPEYIRRIGETMRRLLSPEAGCFDCDGFKIDFANCMPLGLNLATRTPGVYGIELLKRLMTLFHDAAKAVKPDCLINNSCAHPYFAEVTDQCRLHDVHGHLRDLWEERAYRARLFQTAFPGISVDTDDEASSSRRQTLDYLRRAPTLGVPDLYRLHGTGNLPLTDDDFREIARIWDGYSRKLEMP